MSSSGSYLTADRIGATADVLFEMLLQAHSGLSDNESSLLDARLILILANAIGNVATVRDAIALARGPASSSGDAVD